VIENRNRDRKKEEKAATRITKKKIGIDGVRTRPGAPGLHAFKVQVLHVEPRENA
jgi:hypothetical protein